MGIVEEMLAMTEDKKKTINDQEPVETDERTERERTVEDERTEGERNPE